MPLQNIFVEANQHNIGLQITAANLRLVSHETPLGYLSISLCELLTYLVAVSHRTGCLQPLFSPSLKVSRA